MAFELWETSTGNIVGAYTTMDAALDVVRRGIALHGRSYVETWALAHENRRGHTKTLAHGAQLADRALSSVPASGLWPAVGNRLRRSGPR